MSYDLFLFPEEPFGRSSFVEFFHNRPNYSISGDGNEAFYENDDTGVYFSFYYLPREEMPPKMAEEGWPRTNLIAFNMNYFRPHVFALEAVDEVEAAVRRLHCQVRDTQQEGMGDSWDREGFLRGWNWGNAFAYQAMTTQVLQEYGDDALRDPPKTFLKATNALVASGNNIETVWRWNFNRRQLEEARGETFFIPRVTWTLHKHERERSRQADRIVVWGKGVPILIPEFVTHVFIMVDPPGAQPRAKGFLSRLFGKGRKDEDLRHYLVSMEDIRLHGEASQTTIRTHSGEKLSFDVIGMPHGPEKLPSSFFEALEAKWPANNPRDLIELYQIDLVLDRDLLENALAQATKSVE